MPKIILDLANRILSAAAGHFRTKGYTQTDMKTLAAEVGISVGTLYNYYPSKPELFLAVGLLWKEELTQQILQEFASETEASSKIRNIVLRIYENMESFKGLWTEFLRSGAQFSPESPLGQAFQKDEAQLNQRLQSLLRQVWADRPEALALLDDPTAQFAQMLIGNIMHLVLHGQGGSGQNRLFVSRWLDFYFPKSSS